jgi:hypothetical protein
MISIKLMTQEAVLEFKQAARTEQQLRLTLVHQTEKEQRSLVNLLIKCVVEQALKCTTLNLHESRMIIQT